MITGLVPNYLEEIKQRLSLVELISARTSLKKAGKNFKGLCPFHSEKSGSFFVFPQTESYYCFGCHASGDIFTFVMQTEGLDFSETLETLASRAGVTLPERAKKEDDDVAKLNNEKARLRDANSAAATYFSHLLLNSKEGQPARDYLQKRGVSANSLETFSLGFALDSWDALFNYLTSKRGFTPDELLAAGLIGQRENGGGYYDRFRGRLIFPIRDRHGNIIAFGGRVLENAPKDAPKYLNSPQTPLFDKSATLYGFDRAKDAIRRSDRAVIVEGYMDVIIAHQFGFENVVAPLGTALNEKHVTALKKLTRRIVLALDADTAGQMATLKGIEVMKQGFDTKIVPVPTSRGLIRFEQQVDAEIRVATLPAGKDPDEVIREGGKWRELIERALPVIDYNFASVAANVDLNNAKGKRAALDELIPAILEVRDRIEREHYLQKLARLIQTDAELVRGEVNRAQRAAGSTPRAKPNEVADAAAPTEAEAAQPANFALTRERALEQEDFLLAFLLRYPDGFAAVGADAQVVNSEDFVHSENRLLFQAMVAAQNGGKSFADIGESLEPALVQHLARLEEHVHKEPPLEDIILIQEAVKGLLNRVRESNLRRLYEEGSLALESTLDDEVETLSDESADAQFELWSLINGVGAKLKVYYPKPSPIFRDSRDR